MTEQFEVLDQQLFGAQLRVARLKAGYRRAESFIDTVYRRTRVRLARNVLYKIERGEMMPSLIQYMAISITLKGVPFDFTPIGSSLCEEWEGILSRTDEEGNPIQNIPVNWAIENYEAIDDGQGKSIEELAVEHNEPELWLFSKPEDGIVSNTVKEGV